MEFYLGFAGMAYVAMAICYFAARGDSKDKKRVKNFTIFFTIFWGLLGLMLLLGGDLPR